MELQHEVMNVDFWPVEHPMEPENEDRPVKCPIPTGSSLVNDGRGQEVRRLPADYMTRRKSVDLPRSGITIEPHVRGVRKRHHTLTRDDSMMMIRTPLPFRTLRPTHNHHNNNTDFQMFQQDKKFES